MCKPSLSFICFSTLFYFLFFFYLAKRVGFFDLNEILNNFLLLFFSGLFFSIVESIFFVWLFCYDFLLGLLDAWLFGVFILENKKKWLFSVYIFFLFIIYDFYFVSHSDIHVFYYALLIYQKNNMTFQLFLRFLFGHNFISEGKSRLISF